MDEKQAPPSYNEVDGGQPNSGYQGNAPPAGYPPQSGYPPQQAGYPPQQGGYPQGYGGQYGQYPPQQYGYSHNTVVMTQPAAQGVVVNSVPDNMGLAIFTTICCCWPLGIVAIMRAQESRRALERGDVTSASRLSQESRRFSLFAIGGGILSLVIFVPILVFVIIHNINAYNNLYDFND